MSEAIPSRVLRSLLHVTVAAAIGSVVLWSLLVPRFPGGCRANANESTAVATLQNIGYAEREFRVRGDADRGAGAGRTGYGWFRDLAGASPPLLSATFGRVDGGLVTRSGYHYCVWLPARGGGWVAEDEAGDVLADAAASGYRIAAWPASPASGLRAFFTDESGEIYACRNDGRWYGRDRRVPSTALIPPPAALRAEARPSAAHVWYHVR